ncbi:MAG: FAD-binding oxidoreductase [Phormidesmis sp. RL_2_1]|nr:FAD-binding oxidoreductase [Phormidesmis sp. RL_2_1]
MCDIAARLSDVLDDSSIVTWAAVSAEQQQAVMEALSSASPPACLALPGTVEALGKVMALAATHHWRVLPTGQGTKLSWGGTAEAIDLVVSTARLNRVIEHAVGDFTVTVEPGVQVAELRRILAEQRQFLAIDPAFDERATIGGVVATADTGSLRQRYGGLRDMLIGVQFVRYDGEQARAGGRVVKNVAGYDLMKLLTGAYGSLGILSELTFRLYPIQASSRTLVLSGEAKAIEAATAQVRLSGLTPVALDVVMQTSAAAQQQARHLALIARFQGIEAGLAEQTARLKKIATTHSLSCQQLDGEADSQFWQQVADEIKPYTVLCKVGLRPSGIPGLIKLIEAVDLNAQARLYGTSGLGWIQFEQADKSVDEIVESLEKLRSHCQNNAGFLTILQASKALKQKIDVWGYSGNALGVMDDIKRKFDPQRLLSPGRFVGGL